MTDTIGFDEICAGLRRTGCHPGMRLMVHVSLSSFGHVAGGAETVIKALMEVVTPVGTLLLPSFNHGEPFDPNSDRFTGCFDPRTTRTTNGVIPQAFWQMPGVYRSLNPTHAFAAWGRDAQRYIERHHETLTLGEDSPLGLLAREGGYQINLGTTHHATTAKHLAESLHRTPCLGFRTEAYAVRLPNGQMTEHRTWGWREDSCPLTESGKFIDEEMERLNLQCKGFIHSCPVTFFKVWDLVQAVRALLEHGYKNTPPCSRCPIRPRTVAETRPTDLKSAQLRPWNGS